MTVNNDSARCIGESTGQLSNKAGEGGQDIKAGSRQKSEVSAQSVCT